MTDKPLVGAVFERNPTTAGCVTTFTGSAKNGFPVVQHRSNSVFGRTKEQRRVANPPSKSPHTVDLNHVPDLSSALTHTKPDPSDWRQQMSEENQRRVENMTEEERQRGISAIYEQLGSGARETMRKIIAARRRREGQGDDQVTLSQSDQPRNGADVIQSTPPEILAPGALSSHFVIALVEPVE